MDDDLDGFLPPGSVSVSPAALELAQHFAEAVALKASGDWVSTFFWYTEESVTDPATGITTHGGPGLDLGAYSVEEVPVSAICYENTIRFAVRIPQDVFAKAKRKLIDLQKDGSHKKVLLL